MEVIKNLTDYNLNFGNFLNESSFKLLRQVIDRKLLNAHESLAIIGSNNLNNNGTGLMCPFMLWNFFNSDEIESISRGFLTKALKVLQEVVLSPEKETLLCFEGYNLMGRLTNGLKQKIDEFWVSRPEIFKKKRRNILK